MMRLANPLAFPLLALANAYSFVRTTVLLVVEFILAIVGFFGGLIERRSLMMEGRFVLTRVAICILLREIVTVGAKVDIARGLPIVYPNFLGYDEQAHRRGPSSHFAHWSLKRIDDAIARLTRAARRSSRRWAHWVTSTLRAN